MAVTSYQEGDLAGSVTVVTRPSTDGIEIAVTLEEELAHTGGPPAPSRAPTDTTLSPSIAPEVMELPMRGTLAPGSYIYLNPHAAGGTSGVNCVGGCSDYYGITFSVPPGWLTGAGYVDKHPGQPVWVGFRAWSLESVYADPCRWRDATPSTRPFGGANGLATALLNQAGSSASAPVSLTFGGTAAIRIELSVPADVDLAQCDRGEYRRWTEFGAADSVSIDHEQGQIDVLYLVDVDRMPLVIQASYLPASSAKDVAELEEILASMWIAR